MTLMMIGPRPVRTYLPADIQVRVLANLRLERCQNRHDMRAFAACRHTFCQFVGSYLGRAHFSLSSQAFTNRSAVEHLASGAATTSWLYDDPNIFSEPRTEEANSKLVKLVQEARYGAADRLRLHLQERQIAIQRHHVYRKAALASLQWEDPSACVDLFSAWFSLLPYINESKSTPDLDPIQDIRNAILRSGSPATRRPLVKRFALMCAFKGYIHPIYDEVVKLIARFATPTEGATFLLNYEEAVRQYHRDIYPERVKMTGRRYRSAAIEVCCQAGWLDEALRILQLERDFTLPDHTYALLSRTLQDKQRSEDVMMVGYLRSCDQSRQNARGRLNPESHPHFQESTTSLPSAYDIPPLGVSNSLPFSKPKLVSRATVAAQLRAVRRILSAAHPPSQIELLSFLRNATRVHVTPRTLSLLRTKAMSRGGRLATSWLHAELRLHASEADYAQVILSFTRCTPASSTLSPVFKHTLHRILVAKHLNLPTNTPILETKLSKHDRWTIHKAIIMLAVDLPCPLAIIQTLYTDYLANMTPLKGSSRVFATFIWAFAHCGGLQEATMVPHDMHTRGLVPNIRHDVMLAWAYARVGDVDRAMGLLTTIEHSIRKNGTSRLVIPQLVVYGRVIEGFLQAKLFVQAKEVENRMRKTVSYSRGLNRHLDKVLDSLALKSGI